MGGFFRARKGDESCMYVKERKGRRRAKRRDDERTPINGININFAGEGGRGGKENNPTVK